MTSSRYRNFVFTLNNYTPEEVELLKNWDGVKYLVFGFEKGEAGTPHLQGYVELEKQMGLKALKKFMPRMHIEHRRGTAAQAADYCKKDKDFYENGNISYPGKRNDLVSIYQEVCDGKTDFEIQNMYPATYMRNHRAVSQVRFNMLSQNRSYQPVEVHVYHGPAGSGKTRRAYEQYPDLYHVADFPWFDGYVDQETILFDDFYGEIPYSFFLRLLDGYPFLLRIKGSHTWKAWTRVIITSNKPPQYWYSDGLTSALARRLTTCTEVGFSITPTSEFEQKFPRDAKIDPRDAKIDFSNYSIF